MELRSEHRLTGSALREELLELAKRLRRDKKNVSQDVEKLEKLGFLRTRREGQRKLVLPHGNEIHVIFDV